MVIAPPANSAVFPLNLLLEIETGPSNLLMKIEPPRVVLARLDEDFVEEFCLKLLRVIEIDPSSVKKVGLGAPIMVRAPPFSNAVFLKKSLREIEISPT